MEGVVLVAIRLAACEAKAAGLVELLGTALAVPMLLPPTSNRGAQNNRKKTKKPKETLQTQGFPEF